MAILAVFGAFSLRPAAGEVGLKAQPTSAADFAGVLRNLRRLALAARPAKGLHDFLQP